MLCAFSFLMELYAFQQIKLDIKHQEYLSQRKTEKKERGAAHLLNKRDKKKKSEHWRERHQGQRDHNIMHHECEDETKNEKQGQEDHPQLNFILLKKKPFPDPHREETCKYNLKEKNRKKIVMKNSLNARKLREVLRRKRNRKKGKQIREQRNLHDNNDAQRSHDLSKKDFAYSGMKHEREEIHTIEKQDELMSILILF